MERNFRIQATRLLVVEGKDESNLFNALLKALAIRQVQVVDLGGKEKFAVELPLLMGLDGFGRVDALGFVRDAEENLAESAFASLCTTLKKNHLPAPAEKGEVIVGPPKISIFIMPDNQGSGMLENLCLRTLAGQPVERCINDYLACLVECIHPTERPFFNESKARVQAYLASRAPLVNSMGVGALKGYWDFDNPCFADLRRFLCLLFGEA